MPRRAHDQPEGSARRRIAHAAACVLVTLGFPLAAAERPTALAPAATDERAQLALERGYWVVQPGDHLYRIARHFAANEEEARRLANELKLLNDHALISSDASKLVVGARIKLPPRLLGQPEEDRRPASVPKVAAAPGTAPQSTAPPASVLPRSRVPPPSGVPPLSGVAPRSGVAPLAAGAPEPPPRRQPAAPAPPAPPAYVDRVLVTADDREPGLDERARDASPGLRTWAAELRSENRRQSSVGTAQADGVGARYALETERLGDLTVLGQVTHFQPTSGDPEGERTRATGTLLHENFALGGGFMANSALGVIRPLFPVWLTSSYRVSFAPSLLSGAQAAVNSPLDDLRIGLGRIGQLSGLGIQQFERTSGEQAIASYVRRLGPDWSAGGAVIAVRDSENVREHTTATLGVNRELGPSAPGIKIQLASTDDGERAAWFDAQARTGRLLQRFGAYHVDPDFVFGESSAARDVRGVYGRGEYRAAGSFYTFGAEGTQDNLKRVPARGGNDSIGGYGNFSLRLDRTLQAGGGVSARREEPRVEGGAARRIGYANAFVSKAWAGGVTRLDANYNTTRPDGGSAENASFAAWNQEWPRLGAVDFSTQLSQSDEDFADRSLRRRIANVSARGPVYGSLRWDAALTYVDIDDPRGSERNYNASLGLDWNPLPRWIFNLQWYRNRIQPGPDNPLAPFVKEDTVQLTARYEDSAGTPYPRVAGGRSGSGRVLGSVFFDDNGDGVRQASERGIAGVQVVLDERQAAVTDNDGRYQFALVPAGAHRLRVLVERVPLPWGLQDDSPREIRVDVRGDARMDFALTRIGP